jgi:pimeloyl-ACP methyl ester carboxylesterase
MTVVLVHGSPETKAIWGPLAAVLGRPSQALGLPGFGTPRPRGFRGGKDDLAAWLAGELGRVEGPVDLVGHDVGGLLAMRVATAFDVPLRSWVADVPEIFHPAFEWPERVRRLQTPGVGEELLRTTREAPVGDPAGTAARLKNVGLPWDLAVAVGSAHDETMSRSILDFYRSAAPNVAADWWKDARPTRSRGLVLLLPDPPEVEVRSLEVAARLGAETARMGDLEHCWMAQAPEFTAVVLERFWSSLA